MVEYNNDYAHMGNRVKTFAGSQRPLSEFFTRTPVFCFTCHRERDVTEVTIGNDIVIRCLDREDCRKAWERKHGKGKPEEPKHHKLKYKVKKRT